MDTQPDLACPACDILVHYTPLESHQKAVCPRCGTHLYSHISHSIEKTFAISCTGLILLIPTNIYPVLSLSALGQKQSSTLLSGSISLYQEGFYWIALLVLLFSIIIPTIKLLLMCIVSGSLYFNTPIRYQANYFKWYLHLDEWGMLEVYLLSIIVAFVKLQDMADVIIGTGLYCFIALLLISSLLSSLSDKYQFWETIAQCQQKKMLSNHQP